MLNQMDHLEEINKAINVLQAVNYIVDAWNNISTISIRNCFKKAGFSFSRSEIEVAEVQVVDKDNAREEIEASWIMYCEKNPHINKVNQIESSFHDLPKTQAKITTFIINHAN
jgi:hypothetical protein